jgi:hypothetical protein
MNPTPGTHWTERYVGHRACVDALRVGQKIISFKMSVIILEGKNPFYRFGHRREVIIKMALKYWIQVVQCRVWLWFLVKKVMKLSVPYKTENFWAADQLFLPQTLPLA